MLRAKDYPTDRYLPRGKQYWEPKSRSIYYRRTTGIWQTVWLGGAGSSYLKKVRIDTELNGTVKFSARVVRPGKGLELTAKVSDEGKTVTTATVSAAQVRTGAVVVVPDPTHWEPQRPHLYDVTFTLRRGDEVLDEVHSYFGIRTVTVESGRVFINGRPIYLKLILDQGYWPESILTPPTDEALKFDIEATMEMGFNGARKHQKLEDPRWLYWADKLGFLVSDEAANAYLYDEEYVRNFTNEWIETVERDYNHPSVIMWTPINESWGVPDLRDPAQQDHLKALYRLTKSIDRTRPVIDNDGWEHTDLTDLFAFHDYSRTGELLYERYKDLGKPGAAIPPAHLALMLPGFEYNGSPFYLSEFGGIGYIPPGTEVPEESWGYFGCREDPRRRAEPPARALRSHRQDAPRHRHLLHPAHRCRAGSQWSFDLRPQDEIRPQGLERNQRPAALKNNRTRPGIGSRRNLLTRSAGVEDTRASPPATFALRSRGCRGPSGVKSRRGARFQRAVSPIMATSLAVHARSQTEACPTSAHQSLWQRHDKNHHVNPKNISP